MKKQSMKSVKSSKSVTRRSIIKTSVTEPVEPPPVFEPPWALWDDHYINHLKWEEPPEGSQPAGGQIRMSKHDSDLPPIPSTGRAAKAPPTIRRTASTQSKHKMKVAPLKGSFLDPAGHGFLHTNVGNFRWKRPNIEELTFQYEDGPLDLITNNTALLENKLMRVIISSLMCLHKLGVSNNVKIGESTSDSVEGRAWSPFDHVYGVTKSGPGFTHKPQINPYGMYFVRLFYLGEWRRVAVDDYFPYSKSGALRLLRSKNENNIWMPLLTKALLKVAKLSWNQWDDCVDFNPIQLLTGWLDVKINVKSMEPDAIWRLIQYNLIPEDPSEPKGFHPLNYNQCIHESEQHLDERGTRFLFIETAPGDKKLQEAEKGKELGVMTYAKKKTVPEVLPKWKNVRWVDWAISKGELRGPPGSTYRCVDVFTPLEDVESLDEPTPNNQLFVTRSYDYEDFYKLIDKIHVFYDPKYFQFSETFNNLPEGVVTLQDTDFSRRKSSGVGTIKKPPNKRDNVVGDCFYLWTDSMYCKLFVFTLQVLNDLREMPAGYVACEGWKWTMESQGPIWFSMRTYGTQTQALNLGSGAHIMRIWYNLPHKYSLKIYSNTSFTICDREKIISLLSVETSSFQFYGGNMAKLYSKMIEAEPGSNEHAELLASFIMAMCPPFVKCSSIPNSLEPNSILTVQQLMSLFEEKTMLVVFESMSNRPKEKVAKIVSELQRTFLDLKFGEKFLYENGFKEIYHKVRETRENKWNEYYAARLNAVKRLESSFSADDALKATENTPAPVKSVDNKTAKNARQSKKEPSKLSLRDGKTKRSKESLELSVLSDPSIHTSILKAMMEGRDQLLSQYPFMFDEQLELSYYDYMSTTDISQYTGKWIALGRLVFNIHSTFPVPVGFQVFAEVQPLQLTVFNLETGHPVPSGLGSNSSYYLKRSPIGYCLLLLGYPSLKLKVGKVQWRIRAYGKSIPNIPHICTLTLPWDQTSMETLKMPSRHIYRKTSVISTTTNTSDFWGVCTGKKGPDPMIHMRQLSGHYFPNQSSRITRYVISVSHELNTPAALITLCCTAVNTSAKLRMSIKGKDDMTVTEARGTGVCLIPAIYLTLDGGKRIEREISNEAEDDTGDTVFYTGQVDVLDDSWQPNPDKIDLLDEVNGLAKGQRQPNESPDWRLILLVDENAHDYVTIWVDSCDDTTSENSAPYEIDNARQERGRKIRHSCLNMTTVDNAEEGKGREKERSIYSQKEVRIRDSEIISSSSLQRVITKFESQYSDSVNTFSSLKTIERLTPDGMESLYRRFANPNPTQGTIKPQLVKIQPYKTNAPPRLGPFSLKYPGNESGYLKYDDDHTGNMWKSRKGNFKIPIPNNNLTEQAMLDIEIWRNTKIFKMYDMRSEVIEFLKQQKGDR